MAFSYVKRYRIRWLWIRDCRYIQKDIGFPSIDWHEVKRKYDRLIRTDNTTTFPQGKDYFLIICTQLNDLSIPYTSKRSFN